MGSPSGRVRGEVAIRIGDEVLHEALASVVRKAGFAVGTSGRDGGYLISDRIEHGAVDVFLAAANPVGAATGLTAWLGGLAAAMVWRDAVPELSLVLRSLDAGMAALPRDAVERASSLPVLTMRQHRVATTLAGRHIKQVTLAQRLQVSLSSVKRDVETICSRMGVSAMHEVGEVAREMGYQPRLSEGELRLLSAWGSYEPRAWQRQCPDLTRLSAPGTGASGRGGVATRPP
jgi:hypothetical protein